MDRVVFGDPQVAKGLEGASFRRTTVADAPVSIARELAGVGTACVDGEGDVIAVLVGPSSAGRLLEFVEAGDRLVATRHGLRGRPLERARFDLRHGLAARVRRDLAVAPGEDAALLRIEAELRCGDLAAARAELEQLAPSPAGSVLGAWLAVLDARPGDALQALERRSAFGQRDPIWVSIAGAATYWRGRALLDLGRRAEAYAELEALAADPDADWRPAAEELLQSMVRHAEGHSHAGDSRD